MAAQRRVTTEPLRTYLGDRTAKALAKLHLHTVGDLLRYYPRRYERLGEPTDLDKLPLDERVTVLATVDQIRVRKMRRRRGTVTEAVVTDGKGRLTLTFFGQPWLERDLQPGRRGLFAGKVSGFRGTRQLTHPDYLMLDDSGRAVSASAKSRVTFGSGLVPVYPATAQIQSWDIALSVRIVLDMLTGQAGVDPGHPALDPVELEQGPDEACVEDRLRLADPLPLPLRRRRSLIDQLQAYERIHRPQSWNDVRTAQERLRFEEAFVLQVELARRRAATRALPAKPRTPVFDGLVAAFDARLPFELTKGQREIGETITADLARTYPMHRLLQGEVGSGKTVVALRAMLAVVDAGGQTALLAPTEVLAQQHYRSIRTLLGPLAERGMLGGSDQGTQVALVTGSMSAAERRSTLLDVVTGDAGIVVGTHALLQEKVSYADLGLVVIDEQHRFGVEQRAALVGKALDVPPHVLVMTATPIPRTVAMTVFGDLDVSTLTELPVGRAPIQTAVVPTSEAPSWLERAWTRVREEVADGRQAYVVCPRIGADDGSGAAAKVPAGSGTDPAEDAAPDDGERRPALSTSEVAPMLAEGPLAGLRLAVLHGRLPADVKDSVMRRFAAGDIDVLVATTVIEVGVDVPNASTMVVLDADRFGMSQLHQLRGRVGRGSAPGLCLLVTDAEAETPARERLDAVASTVDGFELSRIDLEQRREGDVLGAEQSGRRSSLRLLRVVRDEALIDAAREEASAVVDVDPELEMHPALREEVELLARAERADFLDKT